MRENKLWYKTAALLLLILFPLLIAGCWNRRELRELGIVGMLGIEKADSGVRVTVEIIKPERKGGKTGMKTGIAGGASAKKPAVYIQADGETVFDAFRNATLKSDRRFYTGHNRVIIFGEDIARQGLAPHLDVIFRDHEFRSHAPIAIAVGSSPAEVMGLAAGVEKAPSKHLHDVVVGSKNSANAVLIRILDFMQLYKGQGKNAVVGVLRKKRKPPIAPKGEEYELDTEGAAVFRKDKLVGFLDKDEARGYNWVAGNVKTAAFDSRAPGSDELTTVEVFSAKSKLDVTLTDGGIKLKVNIDIPATVMQETGSLNVNDPDVVAMLEASTAEVVKSEIMLAMNKARLYRSDIFGFGQVVHRKYPKEWKKLQPEWDDLFAVAESEVTVNVNLMRIGKITRPVKE